jgi:hypothetical protein
MKLALKHLVRFALALPILVLLAMRYAWMPQEGYPSWEAVRNYLIRDGEIRIVFPDGVTPISADCDHPEAKTSIEGQQVITKIGYSWASITVWAELSPGEKRQFLFETQKLNNWNRILFLPVDSENPNFNWAKIENGIEKGYDGSIQAK